MGQKFGGVRGTTSRPNTPWDNLDRRMTYAERRRIIFAALTILVYLVLMLSDFAMTISLDEQSA